MNRIDRSNWQTRLVIALAIGLAAGPILYSSFRRELARWCFASSFEHQLEGDRPLALARLKRAVEWDPDNIELLMQLSILQQTPGLIDECVATRDKIVELAARQNTSHRTLLSQRMLISALNGRAYAHALSGKNLDQAAKDIEEAVNLSGPIESALRDTRGYIALLRDELDVAREDIEEALDQAKNDHKLRRATQRREAQLLLDRRLVQRLSRSLDETLAVYYHHRGELYEKLGREDDARHDIDLARKLGFDPDQGAW